jgi:hypothetical protein
MFSCPWRCILCCSYLNFPRLRNHRPSGGSLGQFDPRVFAKDVPYKQNARKAIR